MTGSGRVVEETKHAPSSPVLTRTTQADLKPSPHGGSACNGDGEPDLLVANTCVGDGGSDCETGSVGVLLGNGDGTFQAAISYNSDVTGAASVAVKRM